MNRLRDFAADPSDSEELRAEKITILLVAGSCCLAGLVWTAMYLVVFGVGFTAFLPFAFVLIVGSSLLLSHITKNHHIAIYAQIICIIYITALIQWSIGGVFDSGLVLIWAFIGPMIALLFFSPRTSLVWLALYLVNIAITVTFDDYFASRNPPVPENTKLFFMVMNLSIASAVVFVFAGYFVTQALSEREKANRLLLNVLPKEIAPILKDGERTLAEHFENATVLFADIVGSTPLFTNLAPADAVDWLDEVFSMFDGLVDDYGVEKIRTIGDNYMVAAGVPVPIPSHAQVMVGLALDMVRGLEKIPARHGHQLTFRVGLHSGPLVAGVIGQSKFHYDLWGDTVNTASRMELHGEPGRVHISEATYALVKNDFLCEARGPIAIKGKGQMATWFVTRPKPLSHGSASGQS